MDSKHYYEKNPITTDHTLYHDISCEHRVSTKELKLPTWSDPRKTLKIRPKPSFLL